MPHLEQYLIQQITSLGQVRRFVIGYSGGVDSRVLLELFARLRSSITDVELVALHMNHGLQLASAHWSEHCAATCQGLGIPFHAIELQLTIPPGESTEAVARTARYAAFRTFMQQGDVLVLGHHQDDQVETLLLQLLRGAGPHGLAAMAEEKNFAPGKAIRPLLNIRRAEIESYARENALTWIEDPSNQSLQFDRNYLRHQLLPKLEQRWPSYRKTISRAAGHQANATKLLEDLARLDIQVCSPNFEHRLHLNEMKKLSIERQQNLVRYWIRSQGFSLPNQKMLVEILAIAQLEGALGSHGVLGLSALNRVRVYPSAASLRQPNWTMNPAPNG